ncbi:MAG: hypothetical protein ACE5IB_08370, partial [Candidatus Geothermarchaeales archaeon]
MKNPITVVLALILLSSAIIPVFAGAPNYYAEENADRAVAEEQFTAPVSARPKEWVSTSNFGEVIYERPAGTEGTMSRESVVLEGTLLTDDLPPHAPFPAEPPSSGYESGFPWSKETVRFEITKFGEVPSVLVGNEHAKSQIPIQGEILEIWFIGSTLGHPLQEVNPDFLPNLLYDFVRYVWATYSRPGDALSVGRWQTAIGGYNPFTDGTFASCEEVYQAYGPDIDVGPYPGDFAGPYPIPSPLGDELDGSWVGCIIPDSLKVLVNSTRVGIVKVDMHVEFRAPDGTALTTAPGIFNFQLNKTFVFYKDKRYLKELKNIRVELHKDVAKWLRIQFMEVKEFDVDWSVANQFTMDTAFIQNAVKWADTNNWPYKLNVSKWPGDYSLAIVEPDESASLQHTGYWAFYPVVSNYHANFLAGTRDPWPYPDIARPGASSTSHEGLRLNGRNLVMGA